MLAGAILMLGPASLRLAAAQTAATPGILADGNAVVTGFSGVQLPALIRPGTDPAERATIDLNGPALRVIDLQAPGAAPQAQVLHAQKPFTVTAAQVGQVFAVALDNASPPNIYAAATSVYGLPIVVPDADGDGAPDRAEQGLASARFMAGLFGPPAQQGGPGSIWRIDGATGEVRLFANVVLDGVPNSGPALGGLAFDAASNSLFVADRETGMIHRFDMTGAERGRYDHGMQGRPAAGLAGVPFNPSTRLVIIRPPFQPANPDSWGYAPPQRRVFGLAVREGRLYYTVAESLQVWSVAVTSDGAFGSDARIELSVPPGTSASELSKITFDDQGRILLAERVAPTGAFDFGALTEEGGGRVLRYAPAPSAAGPAWQPDADEYTTGFSVQARGGDGGVAVGYGYDANGALDRNSCSGFVWSTGGQLRVTADAALAGQLAQGGPAAVNGLQGSGIDLVRPANTPPLQSYFVDYDDRFADANARGHMGDVALFRACARTVVAEMQPPPGEPGAPPPPGEPGAPGEPMPPPDGGFAPGPGDLIEEFWPDWPPPPPPVCPVGTHPEAKGVQCCPGNEIPGVSGVCQSACSNGAPGLADQFSCYRGFQPGDPPIGVNPGTCWNGAAPVHVAGAACAGVNSFACNKCPKPPLKRCPSGFNEVAGGPPAAGWPWSNVQCVPIGAVICLAGQQPNMDGVCQDLCPAGERAYPVNRCCVNGTNVNALGQCPGVIVPPQWYLDFLATGTGPCLLPGGNCSYYEFTITGRRRFGRGSLNLRITLPEGSAFPEARVTRGSKYCPTSAWSCRKSGNGFVCSAEDCGLAPGDQVVLRTEGRVVPELTQPPPAPVDKTACAVLDWQALSGRGPATIEQLRDIGRAQPPPQRSVDGVGTDRFGRTSSKQACWTIRVIGKPPTPTCAPNYVTTPDGLCCLAGQMTTRGVCCPAGQTPDPRRRTCIPVPPPAIVAPPPSLVACPSGTVRLRGGECCERSQMTRRGVCCPPGQQPDRRRRTCVPAAPERPLVTPVPPQCRGGKVLIDDRCECPPGTRARRGRCVTIHPSVQPDVRQLQPQRRRFPQRVVPPQRHRGKPRRPPPRRRGGHQ